MITNFSLDESNTLVESSLPLTQAVWIDIFNPSAEERKLIAQQLKISLPQHNEMYQIEFSNRFYEENQALYLSVYVVTKSSPIPESHVVTLIITENQLVTLRYSDPNPIKNFISQVAVRQYKAQNHQEIFVLLLKTLVGKNADIFEAIGERSDQLAQTLISSIKRVNQTVRGKNLNDTLREINRLENLLAKGYQSLSSYGLLISYLQQTPAEWYKCLDTINVDIQVLLRHGEHLGHKLEFQLESTLGLINIEQMFIVKIFTVLAMVFMPPTLIASIYGMNFARMPELSVPYAYPIVLLLMFASAFLPYRFFKRKGWI